MRRLLSANISRLWMNKTFWTIVLMMILFQSLVSSMFQKKPIPMDSMLFISTQGIGILSSVFFSLFLGTEYSDGTIRNKIIVGHSRKNIYFASFLTSCIAITIVYFAGILTGSLFNLFFHAIPSHNIAQIMLAVLIGWCASISYASIFNFIGMLSSSKSKTSILCILLVFILMLEGMLCYSILAEVENAICLFLFEFNPIVQTIQIISIVVPEPVKILFYALLLTSSLNVIGLIMFHKKDLK